ncbi:MAG: carbon-nitrogen hydrolase family protein [Pseudomonadota bacterium]|nr:carbon-nitrogen hydrolase family protein [Pseudomonadota bacterium]
MPKQIKIACIQSNPKPSIEEAIEEARELVALALTERPDFIFFPEYCGGLKSNGGKFDPPVASEKDHQFLAFISECAYKNSVWIMVGSIAISGFNGMYYNRGYIIDNRGNIHSKYNKIHLFDIQLDKNFVFEESATVIGGNVSKAVDTPYGKIGHTICYDLRFPQLFRSLALEGAEILAIPSAFTRKTGEAHWHTLVRARAIENGSFVIAPCATGEVTGGGSSYGHSLIVDPWGHVLEDGGEERGVIVAQIDLGEVEKVRAKIPSLYNDREFNFPKKETERAFI